MTNRNEISVPLHSAFEMQPFSLPVTFICFFLFDFVFFCTKCVYWFRLYILYVHNVYCTATHNVFSCVDFMHDNFFGRKMADPPDVARFTDYSRLPPILCHSNEIPQADENSNLRNLYALIRQNLNKKLFVCFSVDLNSCLQVVFTFLFIIAYFS